MAERGLPRPSKPKIWSPRKDVARLESPPAKQLRVHPAAADGYRPHRGGWSTRVFIGIAQAAVAFAMQTTVARTAGGFR